MVFSKNQFSLAMLLFLVAVCALFIFFVTQCYRIGGPAMPNYLMRQLRLGMTKEEVRRLLGPPEKVYDNTWIYSRKGNVGWVEIWFDEDRLGSVNDESAFPALSENSAWLGGELK